MGNSTKNGYEHLLYTTMLMMLLEYIMYNLHHAAFK